MSNQVKRQDVHDLVDMAPAERAMRMLELGQAFARKAPASKKPSAVKAAIPKSMKSLSLLGDTPGNLLRHLHGDAEAAVARVTGLAETGRTLATAVGEVSDVVMTARGRKKSAAAAVDKKMPVKDLAVRFLGLGMMESDPKARACAAYAYWQATGMAEPVLPVLKNAAHSDDVDEMTLGRTSLARIDRTHTREFEGVAADDRVAALAADASPAIKPSMTVLIHGTFAKDEPWYQPGGDFHKYIKSKVYSDVYSGSDFYSWSGRYALTDSELKKIWKAAATKLIEWCARHPTKKLRLIAHSHGNNVVNLATRMGLEACSLIQLSPPVHEWNLPDMSKVGGQRIFNIRSRFDGVVAIDGGSRTYEGTTVASFERQRIVSFFSHSDSHDKDLWKKKNVPQLVKTVCQ